MLQVELHPYNTQEKLVRYAHSRGVAVTGFSCLGAGSSYPWIEDLRDYGAWKEPEVKEIAARHGKTGAQVVLRCVCHMCV